MTDEQGNGGLDLDAIRERVGGELPITSWIWDYDVPDLIAEVERLTADRDRWRKHWQGADRAWAADRAAVLAVHQKVEDGGCSCGASFPCETWHALNREGD